MSDVSEDFTKLMERVRAGSEDAVRELLDKYGRHILRAVRRRLNRQMRTRYDSLDFYQAVCASFFRQRDAVTRFSNPDDLVAFLGTVAGNKVVDECRRMLQTEKHNVNRERLDVDNQESWDRAIAAKDATPSQIVATRDQIDHLVAGEPSYYRRILELRAGGETLDEIARDTGVTEKTVRRVIKKLAGRIKQ